MCLCQVSCLLPQLSSTTADSTLYISPRTWDFLSVYRNRIRTDLVLPFWNHTLYQGHSAFTERKRTAPCILAHVLDTFLSVYRNRIRTDLALFWNHIFYQRNSTFKQGKNCKNSECSVMARPVWFTFRLLSMGQTSMKTTNPKYPLFLKIYQQRQVFICLRPSPPSSPHPCYTLDEYILLYLFKQERGRWTSEKVRGAPVHKRGRNNY